MPGIETNLYVPKKKVRDTLRILRDLSETIEGICLTVPTEKEVYVTKKSKSIMCHLRVENKKTLRIFRENLKKRGIKKFRILTIS